MGELIKHTNYSYINIKDCNNAIPKLNSTKETFQVDHSAKNIPRESMSGYIDAYRWNHGMYCTQIFYSADKGTNDIYIRISDEIGVFSEWASLKG